MAKVLDTQQHIVKQKPKESASAPTLTSSHSPGKCAKEDLEEKNMWKIQWTKFA